MADEARFVDFCTVRSVAGQVTTSKALILPKDRKGKNTQIRAVHIGRICAVSCNDLRCINKSVKVNNGRVKRLKYGFGGELRRR
jgi:hypothetical protein